MSDPSSSDLRPFSNVRNSQCFKEDKEEKCCLSYLSTTWFREPLSDLELPYHHLLVHLGRCSSKHSMPKDARGG